MSRSHLRLTTTTAVMAVSLAGLSAARGEPQGKGGDAAAQSLYAEATQAMDKGDYAAACPKLEEVVRLAPEGIGAKLTLASCYERAGRLATAWAMFTLAEAAAKVAGQEERRKKASARAQALSPKLARLTIQVSGAAGSISGLQILRDGISVGPAQWGSAMPVDKGEHLIQASAPSKQRWEVRVNVESDGLASIVAVPPLLDERPPLPPVTEKAPSARTEQPPRSWQRPAGFVVGGIGLVSAGMGAFFGGRAIQKKDESNASHCRTGNFCDAEGVMLRDEGLTAATASTALLVAGGILLAGGAVVVITAPSAAVNGGVKVSLSPRRIELCASF